jgi:hypothetical protein
VRVYRRVAMLTISWREINSPDDSPALQTKQALPWSGERFTFHRQARP